MYSKDQLKAIISQEVHEGSLGRHLGIRKTLDMLRQHFYWPKMLGTIGKHILRCEACIKAKNNLSQGRIYAPTSKPWEHVRMDFIVALPKTQRGGEDSIVVVVDRFSKMAHFVACNKINDAQKIARLYYAEIVRLHGVPRTIVSDRDSKFLNCFWKTLWRLLGIKLLFNTSHHPQTNR